VSDVHYYHSLQFADAMGYLSPRATSHGIIVRTLPRGLTALRRSTRLPSRGYALQVL